MNIDSFKSVTQNVPSSHVVSHIERVLKECESSFDISTSASYDDLGGILTAIGSENISKLKIYTVPESGVVKYTYWIDIVLVNGVVRVKGNWTDYKDIRFDEIVWHLLLPIYQNGLNSRTSVNTEGLQLDNLSDDYGSVIKSFMEKASGTEYLLPRADGLIQSISKELKV
ncbi:hypothetical protein [Thiomicrorhabdus hydrogeniphila]